jgi:hypothetical protein
MVRERGGACLMSGREKGPDVNDVGGLLHGTTVPLPVLARGEQRGRRCILTRLSDVEPLPVEWLWRAWIPLGMLTILDGDPGLGKSTLLLDLVARLSRGDSMPDGSPGPTAAGSVILSAEDDLARVIRPRLDFAGADPSLVATLHVATEGGEPRDPTISPEDLEAVEDAVHEMSARLVIVDPLVAFLPADVNAHRDQDVRRSLRELRGLAERTGAGVVPLRHLNKNVGGSALYRGGGSIGIIGAARSGLLLAADPEDPSGEARVLAVVKSNLAPHPRSLRLRLIPSENPDIARVEWVGGTDQTATSLLAVPSDPEERTALDDATGFLREALAAGPRRARDVEKDAAREGIKPRTLRRSRKALRVVHRKSGQPGDSSQHWLWSLPEDVQRNREAQAPNVATASDLGHLRVTGDGKPLWEEAVAEGGQAAGDGHLRTGHSSACERCGGPTLRWTAGDVCTQCHHVVPPTWRDGADAALLDNAGWERTGGADA